MTDKERIKALEEELCQERLDHLTSLGQNEDLWSSVAKLEDLRALLQEWLDVPGGGGEKDWDDYEQRVEKALKHR